MEIGFSRMQVRDRGSLRSAIAGGRATVTACVIVTRSGGICVLYHYGCSFAGRIDPLSLTLSPGPGERRDPVVRPLESQFLQVLMDLFQRAPLFARLGRLGLEER